ncbi:MAG: acyl-CoA/acyl-ACP dehydrogenase [Myxococcales bacterium]|nr:acyl-CoA/acyl-ACP dehydrogenase [Myxococcales bacterium]
MSDFLDVEINRRGLREMAPRLKVLAEHAPDYVRELEEWQAKAREYGDRFIRPKALEIDAKCRRDPRYFDWDLIRQAMPFGFLSMAIPRAAGGAGGFTTVTAVVLEELCAACAGVANIFGAHGLGISGILLGLDFYHVDRSLAEVAAAEKRGEPLIFAAAITEPLAGSDVEDTGYLRTAKLMTEAKPVAGGYRLNGRKVFISNGSVARYSTVIAPLDRAKPLETMTAFLVRAGDQGFSIGRVEEKMGMKACPAAELVFEDCFVPRANLIGREGDGMRGVEIVLGASRGPVGAIATGIARGAFERVVDYAVRKKTGGRRLFDQQWVRIKLAEMARRIHAARQQYLDGTMSFDFTGVPKLMKEPAARLLDLAPSAVRRQSLFTHALRSKFMLDTTQRLLDEQLDPNDQRQIQQYSSGGKIAGSDTAMAVAYEALQIVGLEASLHRHELEKIYRDAKLTQIYEGTNQLNRHNLFVNLFPRESGHVG